MAIHFVDKISVNGLGGQRDKPLFGGWIYDLSYDVSVGNQGSSKVSMNLVNDNGQYSFSQNDLTVQSGYKIAIGSINTTMYPTTVRKKYSSRGYLLQLEFTDGSFILDKYFIGLHKKHGWNFQLGFPIPPYGNNPPCFIIVGHEINPCDINGDTVIGDGTLSIKNIADPCHPCQQDENQVNKARLVDCKNLSRYNIFQVKYNFTELIQQLSARGFKFQGAFDPNPSFYRDYIGSIREVLAQWCRNFGWIFFWDNGTIVFKDLRTVPLVNATIQNFCPDIENFEESYTLEGTFDKMILTNFTRSGADQFHDCLDAGYITMPSYSQTNSPTGTLNIDSNIDYDAAGLAYYSKELRNLYYLYSKYKMLSDGNFTAGTAIPELGLTILSNAYTFNGQSLAGSSMSIEPSTGLDKPAFSPNARNSFSDSVPTKSLFFTDPSADAGQLKSLQSSMIQGIKDGSAFASMFSLLDPETQWKVAANINKCFFFVAHYDDKIDNRNYERERAFAEKFIGKYHIFFPDLNDPAQKDFFQDAIFFEDPVLNQCGVYRLDNDNTVRYEFIPGGGYGGANLKFYNNLGLDEQGDKQTLSSLPFAEFLQIMNDNSPNSGGQPVPFKLVVVEKNGQGFYPSNISSQADTSSIFQNSGNNWLIQDDGIKNQAYTYFPKVVPSSTSALAENIVRLAVNSNAPNVDVNKCSIYLGYKLNSNQFQYQRTNGVNPLVGPPVYFNGDPLNLEIDPVTHKPIEEVVYRYPQWLCAPLGNLGYGPCFNGNFSTPVGNFTFRFPAYNEFACILQKSRRVLKRINKHESVEVNGTCNSGNTLELKVEPLDIGDKDITKFLKLANNTCVFDDLAIHKLHEIYATNLGISQTTPLLKRTFTVGGIPNTTLGINDGLQSISITIDESGVKSTYTFGTTHFLLPDPEVYANLSNINLNQFIDSNDINGAPQLTAVGQQ
jgi:hypothetical protein